LFHNPCVFSSDCILPKNASASWDDFKFAASIARWISMEKCDVNAVTKSNSDNGGCKLAARLAYLT
jgi:hypothetical protein